MSDMERFRAEHDLADLPDEAVETLLVYQLWVFEQRLADLWHAILAALRGTA